MSTHNVRAQTPFPVLSLTIDQSTRPQNEMSLTQPQGPTQGTVCHKAGNLAPLRLVKNGNGRQLGRKLINEPVRFAWQEVCMAMWGAHTYWLQIETGYFFIYRQRGLHTSASFNKRLLGGEMLDSKSKECSL